MQRETAGLRIGPSALAWDGNALTIDIDEVTFPLPSRIRGRVRLAPSAVTGRTVALDGDGMHHWSPLAPCAHVEVNLTHPALRWRGRGYLDSNTGSAPLEEAFTHWHWSRASVGADSVVLYDVSRRRGDALTLATRFRPDGTLEELPPAQRMLLPATGWRLARATGGDAGHSARVVRTLEDTPFYARSLVTTHVANAAVTAMHESLSLDRFRSAWVRSLLPFRMPRRSR